MKVWKWNKRWMAVFLAVVLLLELPSVRIAEAAGTAVLDQESLVVYGNIGANAENPRYQTFTPAVTGYLDAIHLNLSGSFGSPGALIISIYKDGNLSTPLGSAQLAAMGSDWNAVDFSGTSIYLTKETMYRMIVTTEYAGGSGISWRGSSTDTYTRGYSTASDRDFSFKTYMVPDYSLSPALSSVSSGQSSLAADGTSQTTVSVQLKDAQGTAMTVGGETVAITATKGAISAVTDNGNGTYTATLTAPTTVGSATVSASVGGQAIASTASVQFVAGAPSAAQSTVESSAASLTADGVSQTTVSVKLKDMYGNALTNGGAAVTIVATKGTVSAVTDNGNGTYTASLTAPSTVGSAVVSATVGGQSIASTASVQFVVGAASAAASTVEAVAASLTADGTSQTTITVKLKDAQGNALTSGGAAVALAATNGNISAVTDNGNGTYTAVLTASITAGSAAVSATVGGQAIASTASVQFVPGAASAAASTVGASPVSVTADGASQTTVSVQLKDMYGNALTSGGSAVTIAATKGTAGAVTDNGNGIYTASLTAPSTVGSATVSAAVGGQMIASTASVQFVPGAVSTATSTVEAADASLIADGASQSTISVKLKDAQGNALTSGGAVVTIAATKGNVSVVTDNGDGTYTATLIAPIAVGSATVSAAVGGQMIASTASVQFVPGAVSTATSTVEAADASLTADGASQTTISVKLKDAQGNALTSGGAAVTIAATKGSVSAVTDNGDGTYTALLTASTTVSTAMVSAKVGAQAIAAAASVSFVPGAPSVRMSRVQASNDSLIADGASQTTIRVSLSDAQENILTTGGAAVTIASTLGTVSAVTDNGDGTYTAALTASTTLGAAIVSATVGGQAIQMTEEITFVVGEASPSSSTVTASATFVRADGSSSALISVKLMDDYNHPLEGQNVRLQASGGHSIIAQPAAVTDADGIAVFAVSNTTAEEVTYFAKEEASGVALVQTVEVSFVYNQPPTIALQADPSTATFGTVTVHATAAAIGEFNSIASIKWAEGSRTTSFFETDGMDITDQFAVQANGVYSVYALDAAGNDAVATIDIQNIVPLSSNADLTKWELTGAGGVVSFDFNPAITDHTVNVGQATAGLKMTLTALDAYSKVYVNGTQVTSGTSTDDYSLATGSNPFEVQVEAQDGTIKKYRLNIIRAAASTVPNTGGTSSTPSASVDTAVVIQINEQNIAGAASLKLGADGAKTIHASLDAATLSKVTGSLGAVAKRNIAISIAAEADVVEVQLSAEAAKVLAEADAVVTLKTAYGEYRLPMADLANGQSEWNAATKARITIGLEKGPLAATMQKAAEKGGFQLIGSPIYFKVETIDAGGINEIASFSHFAERVIHMPANASLAVSTAVAWDETLGLRPVPTMLIEQVGRKSAVIHSLTSSTYVLVSKASELTDIKGHWAAAEIANMNSRMIVNGLEGKQFKPDAAITRAEIAALLARALGLPNVGSRTDFHDVVDSSWYSSAVAAVKDYGIMDGYKDGTFRPNEEVSRQEAIVMVVRALKLAGTGADLEAGAAEVDLSLYVDHTQIGSWAQEAMRTAILKGLVKGYGNELQPQKLLTRAETTVLIYRMLLQAGLIQ
ncbi:S-layer homology domain-containing protein [Paenibacillus algorifonticola]|uniref:S-layer homology domain-containing protein n=2 Tax=Paenibacillus algorifonticola TaxID=684063 RepID=A0A1I2FTS2_9BACL|nr:S-layer homology domain-containing protein [Paenibacillus algorifonticola]